MGRSDPLKEKLVAQSGKLSLSSFGASSGHVIPSLAAAFCALQKDATRRKCKNMVENEMMWIDSSPDILQSRFLSKRSRHLLLGSHDLFGDRMHLFVRRIVLSEALLGTKVVVDAEFFAVRASKVACNRVVTAGRSTRNNHTCVCEMKMMIQR